MRVGGEGSVCMVRVAGVNKRSEKKASKGKGIMEEKGRSDLGFSLAHYGPSHWEVK